MPHHEQMTAEIQRCIQRCMECHQACMETVNHCLELGGKHAEPSHIRLLMDCAEICATAADFMMRGSHRHSQICGVCEDICKDCAKDCETMANGDRSMLVCAEVCRSCADTCHEMAGMRLFS
jgi:hypothetical protein